MDWNRIGQVALACLTQGWSFIAVSLAIYYAGQSAKRLADRKGWRATHEDEASWFDATLPVQPVLFGALIMQIPFPVWDSIDAIGPRDGWATEAAARLAYGGLAGALAGQVFEITQTLVRFARKKAGVGEDGRKTPIVETPKMVPSSIVTHVEPASDPDPSTEVEIEPETKP